MHILSQVTDNFPSWISGRERMTVEKISWSVSMKEWCWTGAANSRSPDHRSSTHSWFLSYRALQNKFWSNSNSVSLVQSPMTYLPLSEIAKRCSTFFGHFFMRSSSYLQVMRTAIKSGPSSNFGRIRLQVSELHNLEHWKNSHMVIMGKTVSPTFLNHFNLSFIISTSINSQMSLN